MNFDRRQLLTLAGSTYFAGSGALSLKGGPVADSKNNWKTALVLDEGREQVSGSTDALAAAIGRGADLHRVPPQRTHRYDIR